MTGAAAVAEDPDGQPTRAVELRARAVSLARAVAGPNEGKLGLLLLGIFLLVVALGPTLAPYSPYAIGVGIPNTGPRARISWVPTTSAGHREPDAGGLALGHPHPACGHAARIRRGRHPRPARRLPHGRADAVATRVIDVFLSLPPLLIVLVIIATAGASSGVVILSVALVYSPRVARVLRGATQGVATQEYVLAAQARGERTLAILLRELLPNIAPTVLVEFAVRLTYVIIFVTTLNFLGLGVQPPSPNWGRMLFEARNTIVTNPVAAIAPAAALGALSVGIGLIADAITRSIGLEQHGEYLR